MKKFLTISLCIAAISLTAIFSSCNGSDDDATYTAVYFKNILEIGHDSLYYFNDNGSQKYPQFVALRTEVASKVKELKKQCNSLWEISFTDATMATTLSTNDNKALADYSNILGYINQIQTYINNKDKNEIGHGMFTDTIVYNAGRLQYYPQYDNQQSPNFVRSDTIIISYNNP